MSRAVRYRCRSRVLAVVAAAGVLTGPGAPTGHAASGDLSPQVSRTWGVNGRVLTVEAVSGSRVLVGGDFTAVLDPDGGAHPIGHLALFDTATGEFDTSWNPGVEGAVTSASVDGGTVYVGGSFGGVAGVQRRSVAALDLATAALLPWSVSADNQVDDVEVRDGWVYLAGPFTGVTDDLGQFDQGSLARVDTATARADRSWTFVVDGRARTLLAPADRDLVYVGGDFTAVNGASWAGKLTALSRTSAAIDPVFRSGTTNLQYRAPAQDLDLRGNDLAVAVSGSGGGCALLDATTGATRWSKHGNGDIVGVAFHGQYAYCGGHFSGTASFDEVDRTKLAAVDVATGAVASFAPVVNTALGVWAVEATADMLVVGGEFTKVDTTSLAMLGTFRDVETVASPSAVRNVSARPGSGQALVSWGTPSADGGSPVTRYRILRREGATTPVEIGTTTQRSFADSSARNGRTYTYTVAALSAVGQGALSPEVSATPQAGLTSVPSVPRSFAATGQVGAVALTWAAPSSDGGSAVTGFRVLRSTAANAETVYAELPSGTTSFTDTAVEVGVRYYYQLAAVNAVGEGPLTTEKSGVPALGVPSRPVLSAVVTGTRVDLSWTVANPGSTPVEKFVVTRDSVRLVTIRDGTATTYADTSVVRGRTYRYQVKAHNSVGSSPGSSTVTVTIP
ncbi:MAG: fibronectin type III domain-containing protein [Dermatophilaceae bacterium]